MKMAHIQLLFQAVHINRTLLLHSNYECMYNMYMCTYDWPNLVRGTLAIVFACTNNKLLAFSYDL